MAKLPGRFRLAAAPAALLFILAAPAVPGSAQDPPPEPELSWSVAPGGPEREAPQSWFEYETAPGDEITDWVAVTNHGVVDLDFQVYATDAYTTTDGGFALLPADQPAREAGSWIQVEAGRYRVPAGHRVDIPFTLSVPDNAGPGDHAAGVVAAITSRSSDASGQWLQVDQRVAARVYLRVAGPAAPGVSIESLTTRYDDAILPWGSHRLTVTYVVRNTGNLRVTGATGVRVQAPLGLSLAHTSGVVIPELLPGDAVTVTETITGVAPAGRMTVAVAVDPTTVEGALPAATRSSQVWAVPWALLVVVAGGTGLVGWRWWRRRRKLRAGVAS